MIKPESLAQEDCDDPVEDGRDDREDNQNGREGLDF